MRPADPEGRAAPGGRGGAIAAVRREAGPAVAAVFAFSFVINLLYFVSPLYMLQVYDRVLASGRGETLFYLTVIALFALAIFAVLDAARGAALSRLGGWLHDRLAPTVMSASRRAALVSGRADAAALRDLRDVQTFVATGVTPFFDGPWAPVFIAVLFLLHPWLGALALGAALALAALSLVHDRLTRRAGGEAAAAGDQALREAAESEANVHALAAMGMGRALDARWSRVNARARSFADRAGDRSASLQGVTRGLRLAAQVGVLGLGALLVLRGELSAGAMIAASIILGRALAPVEQGLSAWRGFVAAGRARDRLERLLATFPEAEARMRLPEPAGRLAVEGLYAAAPGGGPLVLFDVDLRLEPGETLAVVGPSAAGKSTLCRTLVGVAPPARGAVRLDGAEIAAWPEAQRGAATGFLPQEVELFAGTVRENIARMTEGDPEAVAEAARLAGAHEMILALPEGYDTVLAPRGANLSGGQRQRIGLARALYGDPRLVVLDEPNSQLDQVGEAALLRALQTLKRRGVTVVLVAHRQSALATADKILVLNAGRVEMLDEREAVLRVLAERSRFARVQGPASPETGGAAGGGAS